MKPFPYLQIINITCGAAILALEWPLRYLTKFFFYRHLETRMFASLFAVFPALLLYQATNAALYYLIGIAIYIWGYKEGEVRGIFPYRPHMMLTLDSE